MTLSTPDNNAAELSEREREILRLVATGASNKEIAHRLTISPNTVKVHLRNIFAKVGAASRTEATLHAIRTGLVQVPGADSDGRAEPLSPELGRDEIQSAKVDERLTRRAWLYAGALGAMLVLVIALSLWTAQATPAASTPSAPVPSPVPTLVRWEEKAPMLTARSGLAATVYENQIYAIGGEGLNGVTSVVEKYDPASDSWSTLMPKPVAVADINAAVIGGRIYVPGGRLASGEPTDLLEVYDPRLDRWEQRAPLPIPLSAYAMVAFEGKLYVFGGWDGEAYVASTYEYDPDTNTWTERTPMPTARGFAGAAVAGERVYVIGGIDGGKALASNEGYIPERTVAGAHPWVSQAILPEGRSHIGIVSVAGNIQVIGGKGLTPFLLLAYNASEDLWQSQSTLNLQPIYSSGVVLEGNSIGLIGGRTAEAPSNKHFTYQAIYVIPLPFIAP